MQSKHPHKRAMLAAGLAALVGLGGCAAPAVGTPEQVVTQLANQRWQHLLAGHWDAAYHMLTPAYRALHSQKEYQASFAGAVNWRAAEVLATTCEPEKCTVRIKLTVQTPLSRKPGDVLDTHFDEIWLPEANRWYHYEKP